MGGAVDVWFAIDTATTTNACVLAGVQRRATRRHPARAPLWGVVVLKRWQGRTGAPLDIRNRVGPEAADIVRSWGCDSWACDGIELAAIHHVSQEPGKKQLAYRVQGGSLGPDESAASERARIGVYGHGKVVIHERRLVICLDDKDASERLVASLASIQAEPRDGGLKMWIPREGDSHGDDASAVLRALWFADAGLKARPSPILATVGGASPYAEQSRGASWYPRP